MATPIDVFKQTPLLMTVAVVALLGLIVASYYAIGYKRSQPDNSFPSTSTRISLVSAPSTTSAAQSRVTSDDDDIRVTLEGWASASRAHDLDAHMSYYAGTLHTYYGRSNVSSDYIRADRLRAYEKYSNLDVQLSNIEIFTDSSKISSTATFDKTWNFSGQKQFSGSVRQMLWLEKIGNHWLITGEKDLKVHYAQ